MFDTLRAAGYSKTLKLFILVVSTILAWTLALLMQGNWDAGLVATLVKWATTGIALSLTVLTAWRMAQRVITGIQRRFHKPLAVRVDLEGVRQSGSDKADIALKWEDIRLIQHKGAAHLIRGTDKGQKIEISTRLEGHESASSFLKFAFLLRQEIGDGWRGLLTEVKARLEGPGFHFHYDRDRTNTVFINSRGIRHSSAGGVESEMSWELMRGSVMDVQRDQLRFRHTGTKTAITIPRGRILTTSLKSSFVGHFTPRPISPILHPSANHSRLTVAI